MVRRAVESWLATAALDSPAELSFSASLPRSFPLLPSLSLRLSAIASSALGPVPHANNKSVIRRQTGNKVASPRAAMTAPATSNRRCLADPPRRLGMLGTALLLSYLFCQVNFFRSGTKSSFAQVPRPHSICHSHFHLLALPVETIYNLVAPLCITQDASILCPFL